MTPFFPERQKKNRNKKLPFVTQKKSHTVKHVQSEKKKGKKNKWG
jgi:hypothetical protein